LLIFVKLLLPAGSLFITIYIMPKFAANFSFLYQEMPFLDRYAAAAKDGFKGVEFLFPYEFDKHELAARLAGHGLQQVLFNAPPGDWAGGERGLTCLPGREAEFKQSIATALDYADALACPRVHVVAGMIPKGETRESLRSTYVSNIRYAAREAAKQGVDILIEPLNLRDNPGFFLNRQDHAHDLLAEVGESNVKVQFDLYHCQIVEGDLAMKIRKYLPTGNVGHIQMAGVPMRNEPDVGEVNYEYIFGVIDEVSKECGWDGWVGCEYRPARGAVANGTSDGLGWMRR
jgi:2-dehydrotetronate isomerase